MLASRACLLLAAAVCLNAQDASPQDNSNVPPPFPEPATKLEAFQPVPGAIFTIAHEDLGNVSTVRVTVQEVKNSTGDPIRGVIVEVNGARSFVDADELDALVKGCDSLLDTTSNPTQFRSFEAHYITRGALELTATISDRNGVSFSVQTGRFRTEQTGSLTADQMHQLRDLFATSIDKLAAPQ